MTNYLVNRILNLYLLVMSEDNKTPKPNISKRLRLVLDQLESVNIFDKDFCGTRNSVQENESHEKKIPPGAP